MAETAYIDKYKVYEEACAGCWYHGDEVGSCNLSEPCEKLVRAFASAPAADVAPVRYAHWEEADWREYDAQSCETIRYQKAAIVCSGCRNAFKKGSLRIQSFCPACGAKMDGGPE